MWWYKFGRILLTLVLRLFWKIRVGGLGNIPQTGGFVLASNHASFLDPILLGCACPTRRVGFMAKEELFRPPVFGPLIRSFGAFPIKRGQADRSLFRNFGEVLTRRQWGLVTFPEGTRTSDGKLQPARRGIGALCRSVGVPVIPAYIRGSFEAWPRHRRLPRPGGTIEVRFGNPIEWVEGELEATGDASGALAVLILKKIEELCRAEVETLGLWQTYRKTMVKPESGNTTPGHGAGTGSGKADPDAR